MVKRVTVSLEDRVKERLDEELNDHGDNRSKIVNNAIIEMFDMEAGDD